MNYSHQFHAGNFADVFKHCILLLLIDFLSKKDKPILVIDTHAGEGIYDLNATTTQKTKEYESGIAKIYYSNKRPISTTIQRYQNVVQKINSSVTNISHYPGSPAIISRVLRPQDHLLLIDLDAAIAQSLQKKFKHNKQVAVHHGDGYQALKAFLPPKSGRALVLVDPSFEQQNEFDKIIFALKVAYTRYPIGIFAIWYPIKDKEKVAAFYLELAQLEFKDMVAVEFSIGNKSDKLGLTTCGMIIINPPWKLVDDLSPMLKELRELLECHRHGYCRINRLKDKSKN